MRMVIKNPVLEQIDLGCEEMREPPRAHMGCSMLGDECERRMWLLFRWAVIEKKPARMMRLLDRGKREEPAMASRLRAAGIDLIRTGDDQRRVDFGSHVSGSIDGIINGGVAGAEKTRHIWENKTAGEKTFAALEKHGTIEMAKPEHYVQVNAYMLGSGINRCLYTAVRKSNDDLFVERVRLDRDLAKLAVERGQRIALDPHVPPPINGGSPTWYKCRSKPNDDGESKMLCPCWDFCWKSHVTREVNCRTCAHSTATPESTFVCERYGCIVPEIEQRKAHCCHVLHPELVPERWILRRNRSTADLAAYEIEGAIVMNGLGGTASSDLIALADASKERER